MSILRRLSGLVHGLLFGIVLFGTLLIAVVVSLPVLWSKTLTGKVVAFFSTLAVPTMLFLGGIRIRSRGHEHFGEVTEGYILVANHSSNLDPLALARALGRIDLAFVAKSETFKRLLTGRMLGSLGWMFVERSSPLALKRFQEAVKARRKAGWKPNLVIFPEGTRSPDGKLQKFQIGPFMLSAMTGLPILPVVIRGAFPLHPKNAFSVYPGTVQVDIREPIWPPKKRPKAADIVDVVEHLQKQTLEIYQAIPDLTVVDEQFVPVVKAV